MNVINSAYKYGVKKLLNLGSSCIYPKNVPQPMKRDFPAVVVIKSSLLDVPDNIWQIRDTLFAKSGNGDNPSVRSSSIRIILSSLFDTSLLLWATRYLTRNNFGYDVLLERLLRKHNIALLSHSGFLGTHARIPSLGWIPDFQPLHLKDVFSDNEIKSRNWHYKNICKRCRRRKRSFQEGARGVARTIHRICATI
ncbi:MAG: hypothetical protein A2W23_03615 [Planctomycetes bacterium RBG_16_43_13]|nr:MAG: hypothetical protein A2W23_03615 [Planctomycetes bacterium RBG_16_43_13]